VIWLARIAGLLAIAAVAALFLWAMYLIRGMPS
jgi:hypothetical protein